MKLSDFDIYISLIHYPIKNKDGEIVTTAVTNMDVHDISRLSVTFGLKAYYIVTPITEQRALVDRILNHWKDGYGCSRNNKRSIALSYTSVEESIESMLEKIKLQTGKQVKLIATSARVRAKSIPINDFVNKELNKDYAYVLLFGTGWGLAEQVMESVDYILEPLSYNTDYNHLSVRSAVSIILDRLYNAFGR